MQNKNKGKCNLKMNDATALLKVATSWTITKIAKRDYRPEWMVWEWRYQCGCYTEFGFGRN